MTLFVSSGLTWNTITTIGTGINSLANGSRHTMTSTIDNTSGTTARWKTILLKLNLGSFTPTANGVVEAYLLPEVDGEYVTITSITPIMSLMVPGAHCPLDAASGAKVAAFAFEPVQPVVYKVMIVNSTGASFAASGNSAKWAGLALETR